MTFERRLASVALGVVLAVVAASVVVALVPHMTRVLWPPVIDTGRNLNDFADPVAVNQNAIANRLLRLAPGVLAATAAVVAFVAAVVTASATGCSRARRIGALSLAGGVGTGVGYGVCVTVGHLAYASTSASIFVEGPVTLQVSGLAWNALAAGAVAVVACVPAALAGTFVVDGRDGGRVRGS